MDTKDTGRTPDWPSVGIAADLLAAWMAAPPAPYGAGLYQADTLAAMRWCLEHEPAIFARLVLRALPPVPTTPQPPSGKQSVAGKGELT